METIAVHGFELIDPRMLSLLLESSNSILNNAKTRVLSNLAIQLLP